MRNRKIGIAFMATAAGVAGGLWIAAGQNPLLGQAAGANRQAGRIRRCRRAERRTGLTGPYEIVPDWPKPLSQLKGHEKWTFGAVQGIFAENPNRVFILMRGELPALKRPEETPVPQFGPSLYISCSASAVSQRVGRVRSQAPAIRGATDGTDGRARWESTRAGNTVCWWWMRRATSPRDLDQMGRQVPPPAFGHHQSLRSRQAHLDRRRPHARGLQVLSRWQTSWSRLSAFPAFQATTTSISIARRFLPGCPIARMFVSDGYANTRVVKFDKNGKFLMTWGEKGNPPDDTRPGYFDAVHGVQVRSRHAPRVCHRSLQPSHPGLRRKREVHRSIQHRQAVHSAGSVSIGGQISVDRRQRNVEDPQVRSRRATFCIRGAAAASFPARCGTSTDSAWIRTAISTSPK